MLLDVLLMVLMAATPYYLFLEKNKMFLPEQRPIIVTIGILAGLLLLSISRHEISPIVIIVALFGALVAFISSLRTTNLFHTVTLLLFINAPLILTMSTPIAMLYTLSLILALGGLYLIAWYLKSRYDSANFYPVTGSVIAYAPLGVIWSIYLLSVAMYPPFATNLLYIDFLLHDEIHFLEYVVAFIVMGANFIVGMRILLRSVFGAPNRSFSYPPLHRNEIIAHAVVLSMMALLSLTALKEIFV